ncbi:MAG: aldehyde ferredoxin oxidoreductase family protein [Candidatus Syntropharchaeia archaeon]
MKIIEIDLKNEDIREGRIKKEISFKFIGGRGIGVKLLYDRVKPRIDPLSEENLLIFAVGPLTGTSVPMSGRHAVISKSPLTNTIFDCSAGGFFGAEMKSTGIDVIMIRGRADEPVYIKIEKDHVDIKKGKDLWGKNTKETTNILSKEGRVSCIGRAGEKLVRIANIMNDYTHAAGRGGLGAVMGSKNLKAIVVKGGKRREEHDERFEMYKEDVKRLIFASPMLSKGLKSYGTPSLVNLVNYMRIMPTFNFREVHFKNAEFLSGEYIEEKYKLKRESCFNCPIACRRKIVVNSKEVERPEYETIAMFGPDCGIDNFELVVRANEICNDYGMDTISCGSVIASLSEAENKKIGEKLPDLVRDIGEKRGIGEKLGNGSLSYNRDTSMSVKGLEIPGYDPRGMLGQALGYATSNRGACHLRAYMVSPEIIGKPKKIDPHSWIGKAGFLYVFQNFFAALDSLILCKFIAFAISEEECANLLSSFSEYEYTTEDFMMAGERIWNLERLFNIREGFGKKDDFLPERFFREGKRIDKREFENTLSEYYRFRGWNEDGIPEKEKLKKLGLEKEALSSEHDLDIDILWNLNSH